MGAIAAQSSQAYRVADPGKPFYVVVEKILSYGELMRPSWLAHGATGYGFLNQLNGVFVERANEAGMRQIYERFTGQAPNFADLIYECKKLILRVAMSSESHVLARRLDRISKQRRRSRDFSFNSLQYALDEVIACFPVYRSYTRKEQAEVCQEDCRHIIKAISEAKRRNPATSPSIFDFIGKLLLLEVPAGLTEEWRDARRDFILRFQQLTGPVTAKGGEDTAFYRYYPLASLNEVGGDPQRFGITVKESTASTRSEWSNALTACRPPPRTTPNAVKTCARGSTSFRRFRANGIAPFADGETSTATGRPGSKEKRFPTPTWSICFTRL